MTARCTRIGNTVTLTGRFPAETVAAIGAAQQHLAKPVSDGFDRALTLAYNAAVAHYDLDTVGIPEITLEGAMPGPVRWTASVTVMPEMAVRPGYRHLTATVTRPDLIDKQVADQIAGFRAKDATLQPVNRPAETGDVVTAALTVDDVPVGPVNFTAGYDSLPVPELAEILVGAGAGRPLAAMAAGEAGGAVRLHLDVTEVSRTVLPELTDEWVAGRDDLPFDTVDDLEADVRCRLEARTRYTLMTEAAESLRPQLLPLLVGRLPQHLVEAEIGRRTAALRAAVAAHGATVDAYLAGHNLVGADVDARIADEARSTVAANLALRAIARAEHLRPSDDDIALAVKAAADNQADTPDGMRRTLIGTGQMGALRWDTKANLAMVWIIEHARLSDADGTPVSLASL